MLGGRGGEGGSGGIVRRAPGDLEGAGGGAGSDGGRLAKSGPGARRENQQVGDNDRQRADQHAIGYPEQRARHLDCAQPRGLGKKIRGHEYAGRGTPQAFNPEGIHVASAGASSGSAKTSPIFTRSVLSLSHSSSVKPYDSNSSRISPVLQRRSSSRIGTMMLKALSLKITRFAMRASCLFSETAMLNPSLLFTYNITCTSDPPSP